MDIGPQTLAHHPALAAKAFGVTDRGRVRPSNEDHFLSAELTKTMRIWQTSLPGAKAQLGVDRGHLFLVADGMGGHRAGEEASALAVVAIGQFTLNTFKWFFDSNGPDAQKVLTQFQTALRHRFRHVITNGTARSRACSSRRCELGGTRNSAHHPMTMCRRSIRTLGYVRCCCWPDRAA